MASITTKTCDSCGCTVTNKENSWGVWASPYLYLPFGVSRRESCFDLCPACQDEIMISVNRKRASRGLGPLECEEEDDD